MQQRISEAELVRKLGTFKGQSNGGMEALRSMSFATFPPAAGSIAGDTSQSAASIDEDICSAEVDECLVAHGHPAFPIDSYQEQGKAPANLPSQTSRASRQSIRDLVEVMLEATADEPDWLDIASGAVKAMIGTIKNGRAKQQGSMPHPLTADPFQALPGSNSLVRWKPLCEAGLSKSRRKRQATHIAAMEEAPAAPLPMPPRASRKKTFQQQISAGVLAEQCTNTFPSPTQPLQSVSPAKPSRAAAFKENSPPQQQGQAAAGPSLAQLFRRRA